jgi:hypothetical protein
MMGRGPAPEVGGLLSYYVPVLTAEKRRGLGLFSINQRNDRKNPAEMSANKTIGDIIDP